MRYLENFLFATNCDVSGMDLSLLRQKKNKISERAERDKKLWTKKKNLMKKKKQQKN